MIEEYGKKGFEVLCVTAEPKAPTEKFIEDTKLTASVALLSQGTNSALMQFYGAKGYPSSALVDPKGKVVWTGHPGGLNGKIIEEHIGGARVGNADGGLSVDVELPRKWASAAKSLQKGDIGRGLVALDKALADQGLAESDRETLEKAQAEARALFESGWNTVETAAGEKRYYDALAGLEPLVKHYKGHEFGDRATARQKELKGNKELKDEIEAGRRIAGALEDLAAEKADKARRSLEGILSGPLKETEEAKRAQRILDEMGKD
ncbi:MAG: redoxin domain-containing protein [Planctomycetes bacterium]|nr:redoxin domain-containing protein [Planctomycetota bacterium]